MRKFILATGLMMSVALNAQNASPFTISFNGMIANADLNKVVSSNNLAGYGLGLNYHSTVKPGMDIRYHATLFGIKGQIGTGFDNVTRPSFQGGFELYQSVGSFSVYGGLTGTSWKQSNSSNTNYLFKNSTTQSLTSPTLYLGGNNTVGNDIKWGYRVGIVRSISENWSFDLGFSQTEMNKVFSPSWFTVALVYRFE